MSDLVPTTIDRSKAREEKNPFENPQLYEEDQIDIIELENDIENAGKLRPTKIRQPSPEINRLDAFGMQDKSKAEIIAQYDNPVEAMWRNKAANRAAEMYGVSKAHVLDNFEDYAGPIAGANDGKSFSEWLEKNWEAGKKNDQAARLFHRFIFSGDEDAYDEAMDIMDSMPKLPASPSFIEQVGSSIVQTAPRMVTGAVHGQMTGIASGLVAKGMATAAGLGAVGMTGVAALPAATLGGLVYSVASLARSGTHSYESYAGSFAMETYMDAKEAGLEPDREAIRNLSIGVGAIAAITETVKWNQIMTSVPGLNKYFNKKFQKSMVNVLTKAKDKYLRSALAHGATAGAIHTGTGVAAGAATGGLTEIMQEMGVELGRELYQTLDSANRYSRQHAKQALQWQNEVADKRAIDEWLAENKPPERILERDKQEMVDKFTMSFIAGAVMSGGMSVPGFTAQGLKKGSTEYQYTKARVNSIVSDALKENDTIEGAFEAVRDSTEFRAAQHEASKDNAERLTRQAEQFKKVETGRILDQSELTVYQTPEPKVEWDSKKKKWVDDFGKEYSEKPKGEYYLEGGQKVADPPTHANIITTEYDQVKQKVVTSDGREFTIPPWDPMLRPKSSMHREAGALQVHRVPKRQERMNLDEFMKDYGVTHDQILHDRDLELEVFGAYMEYAQNPQNEASYYIDEFGNRYDEAPEGADVHEWTSYNPETGIATTESGDTVLTAAPPWEITGARVDYNTTPERVDFNPDIGKYVDEFGQKHDTPPEGTKKVLEWRKEENFKPQNVREKERFGHLEGQEVYYLESVDDNGNIRRNIAESDGKPWQNNTRVIQYTDPETGKPAHRTIRAPNRRKLVQPEQAMQDKFFAKQMREEQAKAMWAQDMDAREKAGWEKQSFEDWVQENEAQINSEIYHRFEVDTETDLRNYRQDLEYAENFVKDLNEEHRKYFAPAVERYRRIVDDLDAGVGQIRSFQDAMADYSQKIETLKSKIANMRAVAKGAKGKEKADAWNEISSYRRQVAELLRESEIFTDIVTRTHEKLSAAYYNIVKNREHLENLQMATEKDPTADVISEIDTTLKDAIDKNTMADLDEGYSWYEITGQQTNERWASKQPVAMERFRLDWLRERERYVGELRAYHKQRIAKMANDNKKRIVKMMVERAERIMTEPPLTVHIDERKRIEALQKLIHPSFMNRKKLAERNADWQDRYNKLIDTVKKSDNSKQQNDAIMAALDLAKEPLNNLTLDQLNTMEYGIEMLKAIGRAKNDSIAIERRINRQFLVDYAIDAAKEIDIDMLQKSVDTAEYQNYIADTGFKKRKNAVLANILSPSRLFDALDGGNANYDGPLHDFFIKQRNKLHGEMKERMNTRNERFKKKIADLGYDETNLFREIEVGGDKYPVQTVMTYYAAIGDEGYHKGNPTMYNNLIAGDGNGVNPHVMEAAVQQLTSAEKEIALHIMDDYLTVWDSIAQVYTRMTGKEMGIEESYLPMEREWANGNEDMGELIYTDILLNSPELSKKVEDFFTNTRQDVPQNKIRAIKTDMVNQWQRMVEKQERYVSFAEQVAEYKRVINDKDFQKIVKTNLGSEWNRALSSYVDSQAKPYHWRQRGAIEDFLRKVKHNSAVAFLGYNAQTVMKQIPSIAFYIRHSGMKNFMAAAGEYTSNRQQFIQNLKDIDPEYKYRQSEIETVMYKEDYANFTQGKIHKFGENSLKWIKWMDAQVVAIGETATINALQEQGYSKVEAVKAAQDITQKSQPNADPSMLAMVYKGSEAKRMALLFSQQRMKILEMIAYDIPANLREGAYKDAMRTFAAVNASAIGIMLAQHKRLPEDEAEFAKWYAEWFFSLMPFVGDSVVSAMNGYENDNPVAQGIKKGYSLIDHALSKKDSGGWPTKKERGWINDALYLGSIAGPLPSSPLNNMMKAAKNGDPLELVGGMTERENEVW